MKKTYTISLSLALIFATHMTPIYAADATNGVVQVATTTVVQNGVNNHAASHTQQSSVQHNSGNDTNQQNAATQISNAAIYQQGNFNHSTSNIEQWSKQSNQNWNK